VVSPAHYAAAAGANFEVLQAMTMMNLKIFHQKDKDGALPLHYAAQRERGGSEYIIQQNPSATRALAKPSGWPTKPHLFHRRTAPHDATASVFQCLLEADPLH
jgi:ankyrin repeat protein